MEKHLKIDDYLSIIDMVNATEDDLTMALELLKSHNIFSSYLVAMNLRGDIKKRILKNVNELECLDTSISNVYRLLNEKDKLKDYKELFKYIITTRLKNATAESNLHENIKDIKTIFNV